MLGWTLLGELYSIFILLILFVRCYFYEHSSARNGKNRLFLTCLVLSMGFIFLNILCVYALGVPQVVPRWCNIVLNTVYFQVAIGLTSLFAYLLFGAMLEHVYDKHCMRRAITMLSIINVISVVLLVTNLFTGAVFYIDREGIYHRGPWNRSFYLLLVAEVVFLCICYIRNKSSIGTRMFYVMRSLPPLIVLLCVLQVAYPNILLNGTICSSVSLVIFIAFRSYTEETDSLTGVGSRKAFMGELALRSGSGQPVQLIQFSVLNMSDANLRWGHAVGDALLYEVAKYCRKQDYPVQVYRTGSVTFTLILQLESEEQAEYRLQHILERLQQDWVLGNVHCQISIAAAELRSKNLEGTPSEIVERLEYTMSEARKKPPLARFNTQVSAMLEQRNKTLDFIRHSIDEHRFYVMYQPLYCCHRDIFCSAEALLRLKDEEGNHITPDVFIPLAEEHGLITELTWIVLEEVCRLISSGVLPKLETVSVNLSMQQLLDPDLASWIKKCLERYHVEPNRIKLEITERYILQNVQYAREQMHKLEELGIQIYMDDFGTGYSNISSVLHFPFAFVKLDRSLVASVVENREASITVRALLKLFRDLGKRVVAEGVETKEQAEHLKMLGIDMIQGFYYAKPALPDELKQYFS